MPPTPLPGADVRTLARSTSDRGELALLERRASDGAVVHELVVNGAFAMDSREVASELRLAGLVVERRRADHVAAEHAAADPAGADRLATCRVVVGGLGLGFTAAALLDAGVGHLDVVELEADLVAWARGGVTEQLGRVAADPRCRLHVADVVAWLQQAPAASVDAVLLDVDNGPDFLIHDDNARLYTPELLARALDVLVPGGLLAVWCQHATPGLRRVLSALGPTEEVVVPVQRGRHAIEYAIYLTTRPG